MKHESKQLNAIFEALAHQHRRAMVHALSLQPASISQLAKQQKLSLPAIHKHIVVLESAGLILRKKSGRSNFLALNRITLQELREWIQQYHTYWGSNKESLENYVSWIERDKDK